MKNKIMCVLVFSAGAAVGAVVAWKVLDTKYEERMKEETKSLKELYCDAKDEDLESEEIIKEDVEVAVKHEPEVKPSIAEYAAMLAEKSYTNYATDTTKEEVKSLDVNYPYQIQPEEFGCLPGYDTAELTFFDDGVLADEDDDEIEDYERMVGVDFPEYFGDYDDDVAYVRNDELKYDYAIAKDPRTYDDYLSSINPHLMDAY